MQNRTRELSLVLGLVSAPLVAGCRLGDVELPCKLDSDCDRCERCENGTCRVDPKQLNVCG